MSEKKPVPGSREEMRQIRLKSNWVNMIIALVICFGVVFAVLMLAPQPKGDPTRDVDVTSIGKTAEDHAGFSVYTPQLLEDWKANDAHFTKMGRPETDTWYVSMVGPQDQWISVRQSQGDDDWLTSVLDGAVERGESKIDGVTFTEYESKDLTQQALVGKIGGTTIVFKGSARWESYHAYAEQAVEHLNS
ncbi:DUF4245 domain-containing protein [Brevibacterium sp. Marseille-P9724]|uniref:DUF4245 domain-containing protein n=1 Tax=Brevibacterium sp. Marseille-P9724 TaxID=2614125 RepID=UPI00125F6B59|nr:DUF4245 domain-containing protein [Brevibacterium sp. Marseille-P9724]